MAIWYRTGGFGKDLIKPVEVVRESDSFVWVNDPFFKNPRRTAKTSTHDCYFPAWEGAKAHLVESTERKAASYQALLDSENKRLEGIKSLVKPEGAA